jgi:hypothetical protein
MTQVRSSGGALGGFAAAPVPAAKAKPATHPVAPKPERNDDNGTQVSFGKAALHALEDGAEFVVQGVEDAGHAVYDTVKAVGNGVVDAAVGLEHAVADGIHEVVDGAEAAVEAIGNGIVHTENVIAGGWSIVTKGVSEAATLANTLGQDANKVVSQLGSAANTALSGVSVTAKSVANYGAFVAKTSGKLIDEIT